jgi:outer membrane receptor for monomeric catechols
MRQNLGRTSAPGFEIDATARLTNHFDFSTGYQYVNAKVVSAPAVPSLIDTWVQQVPHSAYTFQARYSSPRLINFSVNGRFIGQQLDTNGGTLDNFFVLDAMASREICHGVSAFVASENLLNQTYFTAAPTFSGATLTAPPQLGLPVTVRFGLKFSWPSVN